MTDIRSRLGKKIKKIRQTKKMSQETLAFESNLHRTYISDVINNKHRKNSKGIKYFAETINAVVSKGNN